MRDIRPYDHAAVRAGQRQALDIYLWSRAAIWVAAIFAFFFFEPNRHPNAARWDTPRLHDLGYFTDIWARWDSDFFLRIAQNGYDDASAAFHPLYPALIAALGRVFFGHYVLAGLVISLLCCLGSFALLHRLAEERLGAEGARRSVLYLAVFPMALFLQAVYSESLFLLLVLAAFTLVERERFALGGLVAGLAILTRASGLALLPALVLLAWRHRERRRALAGIALALPVAAVYPLVLWRRFGAPYGLFAAVSLAIPLSYPSSRWPLLSLPRFGLVIFPFFLALAAVTADKPRLHTAVVACSALFLGVAVVQWALWQWLA